MGRRVLKFDGAFGPEGCGIALTGDSIKSALRIHLSVSYGMIGILVISHLRWHFLERSEAGLFSYAPRAVVKFFIKGRLLSIKRRPPRQRSDTI